MKVPFQSKNMISIIVAIDEKNGIGKDNQLLCHLSADLKHFKEITIGKTVIMGRNTFLSLPKGVLPNRQNIIVSSNPNLQIEGATVCHSIDQAIMAATNSEIVVMGGASIYLQTIDIDDKFYFTRIEHTFEADTFFPEIDEKVWKLVSREHHDADEKNAYSFMFEEFERV